MSWKRTIRSIGTMQRQFERDAQRRRGKLERQRKQIEKMEELERAAFEVEEYENYIALLLSVHKEAGYNWDWEATNASAPPARQDKSCTHEDSARKAYEEFKPNILDKTLKRVDTKREKLLDAIEKAKLEDEQEYQEALRVYEDEYANWEILRDLARRILAGDSKAYLDAITQTDPFGDIRELGSTVEFRSENSRYVEVTLHANSEQVVPSEAKSLLKSGRVSVKPLPKSRFYEIYQDYICSCVLRVARELFALLPIEMVIVNVMGNLLNTKTGYMEDTPILSVAIPRKTIQGLNIDLIDPSDSMNNFVHRMNFKKTQGFSAVEALIPSDLQL